MGRLALFVWTILAAAPSGQAPVVPAARDAGVTISGSVVDAALAPLPGVTIALEQAGRVVSQTTTGHDGAFRFTSVEPGDYRVRAELAGYTTFTRDLHAPSGIARIQLPIVLVHPGEQMTVTTAAPIVDSKKTTTGSAGQLVTAPPPAAALVRPPDAFGAGGGAGGGGGRRGGGTVINTVPSVFGEAQVGSPYGAAWRDDGPWSGYRYPHPGESYLHVVPNAFQPALEHPLSTFGADVDTASYANVRRFLSSGQLPPRDAVRVEEFVNYFRFDYDEPRGARRIALTTEVGDCPWAPAHKLVLIGARARTPPRREIEGRNLVLLIDVSGSMAPPERLPMIKSALAMFVDTLQPDDRLAIVTYAGTSGVALPPTPVRNREVIQSAIASLSAGGFTNGGQGLIMAYRVARESFIPGGVNRVILATDGDFNVGIVNQRDLVQLIAREKDSGVFLSVFGVGAGNLKDSTMEMLADRGNGHYAYLDSLQEARRVLIREGDATLETVAKDVKFQVEFNPGMVAAWKLIGYEDRRMAAQDFNDDRKDGGEVGAGHTVTVLYEIVPVGADDRRAGGSQDRPAIDPLKYGAEPQVAQPPKLNPAFAGEWLTVKVRYKAPDGSVSDVIVEPVRRNAKARFLPLASAVAEFGLLLQSGSSDESAWEALARRAGRLQAPNQMAADLDAFRELVAIASGLTKIR